MKIKKEGDDGWLYTDYESNDEQAHLIAQSACKPVFSYESGRIFNP